MTQRCLRSLVLSVLACAAPPLAALGADCNSNGIDDAVEVGRIKLPAETPTSIATGTLLHDHARQIALVDIDGDTSADLITRYDGEEEVTIRRNVGGSFGPVLAVDAGTSPEEFAVVDINKDGLGDIVTTSAVEDLVRLHIQSVPGTFAPPVLMTRLGAHRVALGDVDGDERPDLIVSQVGDIDRIAVSRTIIDPQFRDVATYAIPDIVRSMSIADLDGDGDADLLFATDTLMLMLNQSGGEFTVPIDLRVGGAPFVIADVDGDELSDIVTVDEERRLLTLVNLGDGRKYRRHPVGSGDVVGAIATVDYDGDDDLDIVTVVGAGLKLFSNAGSGRVFPSAAYLLPDTFFSEVQALDGDGKPEVAALDPVEDRVFFVPIEVVAGVGPDCNANHMPDACDAVLADCDADGVPDECEVDSDGDQIPDPCDQCAIADDALDSDGDGVVDCLEQCPRDPQKTTPGPCGCGIGEVDADRDSIPDCIDTCPGDRVSTPDRDGDGVGDACDACPADPVSFDDTLCDCGVSLRDTDLDGSPDCADDCLTDPAKQEVGICGCFLPEIDLGDVDRDRVANCVDNCSLLPNKNQADGDQDGIGDLCDTIVGENCTVDCDDNFTVRQNDLRTVIRGIFDPAHIVFCDTADVDRDGSIRAPEITLGILQADSCLPPPFVPNPRIATEFFVAPAAYIGPPLLCRHDSGHLLVWRRDVETLVAQKLDLAGRPMGNGFQLNVANAIISLADLSCTAEGNALVTWTEGLRVFGRFVRPDGFLDGGPFEVVDTRPSSYRPGLAASGNGAGLYVVAWTGVVRRDGTLSSHVFGRLYGSDGNPRSEPVDLGEGGFFENRFDVGMTADGSLWVLRLSDNSISKYAADGFATGEATQLSSEAIGFDDEGPQLTIAPGGAMLAVWIEERFNEPLRILARAFTAAGEPMGSVFRVASPLALSSPEVFVRALSSDQFVVAWVPTEPAAVIQARVYSLSRGFLGEAFQVNQIVGAAPPAVAQIPQGFLAVWYGNNGFGQTGVFGRRLSVQGEPLPLP